MVKPPFELPPLGGISAVPDVHVPPELQETETFDNILIPPFCEVEYRALKGCINCE
jgi:hypothetical protein